MFSKTADPTHEPAPSRGRGNASRSVLGSDLVITGEITSTGVLEVLGVIDGNVTAQTLTLGHQGRISGSVNANTIEVLGHLDGKVESRNFTLRASSQVAADITYETLIIESGATIEGRFNKLKA